jgi:hypothetical protein
LGAPFPDTNVREAMNVRAKNPELDAPATSAGLVALVRLIARQAASEWIDQRSEGNGPSALTPPEQPR